MPATHLTERAIVRVTPQADDESASVFLQGLLTNDVAGPLPVYAALLSAQGKHLFDFLVWADGDDLLLDCEAELADELVRRLSLYRLRRKLATGSADDSGRWPQKHTGCRSALAKPCKSAQEGVRQPCWRSPSTTACRWSAHARRSRP